MQSAAPFHTQHGIKETAESRGDSATDRAEIFLSLPLARGREERKVATMMSAMFENPLLPQGHSQPKAGLEIGTEHT